MRLTIPATAWNTTLQQLSTGSKINSGADDAAGLSLVDGLEANQSALTQSETNATEGVGLLQVADGALSQVTTLLNRAVALATEASNGTLNSTQDTAANQEYQSILSEINNIGSTTTYNQEQVFGSNTNIYTGDSSQAGSSVDALNIASLSSSDVGDTNGVMSYNAGQANVFVDLTADAKASTPAQAASHGYPESPVAKQPSRWIIWATTPMEPPAFKPRNHYCGHRHAVCQHRPGIDQCGQWRGPRALTASFTTAGAAGDTAATGPGQYRYRH